MKTFRLGSLWTELLNAYVVPQLEME